MASIHPKWLIDEYAINFRNDDWLIPPILPTPTDQIIDNLINILLLFKLQIIINGAIFCHVIKIIHFIHLIFVIISGIHLWNGAAPNFIRILIVINILIKFE